MCRSSVALLLEPGTPQPNQNLKFLKMYFDRILFSNTCLSTHIWYMQCFAHTSTEYSLLSTYLVSVDHEKDKRLCVLCIVMVSTFHLAPICNPSSCRRVQRSGPKARCQNWLEQHQVGFHANATAAMDTDGQALALQIPMQLI